MPSVSTQINGGYNILHRRSAPLQQKAENLLHRQWIIPKWKICEHPSVKKRIICHTNEPWNFNQYNLRLMKADHCLNGNSLSHTKSTRSATGLTSKTDIVLKQTVCSASLHNGNLLRSVWNGIFAIIDGEPSGPGQPGAGPAGKRMAGESPFFPGPATAQPVHIAAGNIVHFRTNAQDRFPGLAFNLKNLRAVEMRSVWTQYVRSLLNKRGKFKPESPESPRNITIPAS